MGQIIRYRGGIKRFVPVVMLAVAVAVAGCIFFVAMRRNSMPDKRLARIDALCATDTCAALRALESINPSQLSQPDRDYYDLLQVKVPDRAYVKPTGDSLILHVLGNLHANDPYSLYPEALYYGGRVYRNLGDYPTSLKYFQAALDAIPPKGYDPRLKSKVLSQTGRLLKTLGIYSQAEPYVRQAMATNLESGDSLNHMYNLELLARILSSTGRLDSALILHRQALREAECVSPVDAWQQRMYIADLYNKLGITDSALHYIQNIRENIDPQYKTCALVYATRIYKDALLFDSAFQTVWEMKDDPDSANKRAAYTLLFSPELRRFVPSDSLLPLTLRFNTAVVDYLDTYDSQAALQQQSTYNYLLHDRDRLLAEKQNSEYRLWLIAAVAACLLLLVAFLVVRQQKLSAQVKLLSTERDYALFKKVIDEARADWQNDPSKIDIAPPMPDDLRDTLRNKALNAYNSLPEDKKKIPAPEGLKGTQSFMEIHVHLSASSAIPVKDELWNRITADINRECPLFLSTVRRMSSKTIREEDLRLIYLIKYGLSSGDFCTLLGRGKGTISSKRASLSNKIFGRTLSVTDFDNLIRLI